MTGMNEFEKLFGSVTVLNVMELLLAATFLFLIYRKVRDYLVKRYEATKEKDKQLQTALDAVQQYPKYRQQSIKIQHELEGKIKGLTDAQAETNKRLEKMEQDRCRSERNKLRERLIQSYRYFTDKERNPTQVWSRMEADAFWAMFGDYEEYGGDGYVHTVIQPAMNLLTVVEMNELELELERCRLHQTDEEIDNKRG